MALNLARREFLKVCGGSGLLVLGGGLSLLQPRSAPAAQRDQADAITLISDVASNAPIAFYNWKNRGKAPPGYIKGMAVSYAKVYYDLAAQNACAVEMAKAVTADAAKDALKHYEEIFQQAGMDNTTSGENRLRHLFVLMLGLGMRESSGRYCEGRDRSANNTTAETAEAGLFQTSFNARHASPLLPKLFKDFMANPTPSYLDVFKEGVRAKESELENYGAGDGRDFQKLSKDCPFFALEFAAIGLRNIRKHWGPINRRDAEIKPDADVMFKEVQKLVDQDKLGALLSRLAKQRRNMATSNFLSMNRKSKNLRHLLVLFAVLVLGAGSCSTDHRRSTEAASEGSGRQRVLLDPDWKFHPGHISPNEVTAPAFDDGTWRRIDLPHDYALDGPYVQSDDVPKRSHGYLPVDVAWYRKHVFIPETYRGKILRLDFDGVFRDSQVWINGQLLGRHPSGYTPFSYDITKFAKFGSDNVIVVRVDPREFEGHWYEGAGIYRHVYLTALAPLHLAKWGTYVVSTVPGGEQGANAEADLAIQTTLENDAAETTDCQVVSEIIGPDGKSLRTIQSSQSIAPHSRQEAAQRTVIEHPKLWSLTSPQLYALRSVVKQNGKTVDAVTTTFGIRTIAFDADKGFFLNGQHVEIQGCANHQDMPAVGIAVPDSLQPWRVQKLKEMGCNGWRTAHNPPNEAVLDACDRIGMLVMDENRHLGDAYGSHSPPGTTADDLSDLATMIQRDRHHPSIIMWSLCNEEGLRGKPEGMRLFAAMKDVVHRYDTTRPITSAINGSWLTKGISDEDILGVNYHDREYDDFRRGNPRLPMFGSETTNQKTTRGEYAETPGTGMCSSYNLSERGWLAVADRPYIAGVYTWTGFDYRGEPNPYGWPHISNNTGLMDVCGFPKDKYYYFQSCWSDKPMVHLLPGSWNWPEKKGQNIRVLAFSNAQGVELFLNGKSLGAQEMPHDAHVEWQVPYEPGTLSAQAFTGGKLVATDKVETTGPPHHIELKAARTQLHANEQDTVIVSACILDKNGRVVPDQDQRVTFQLTGGGKILGVGNGNPADHDPDRANQRTTFHGRCIAIIQTGPEPTVIKLDATSPQLVSDHLRLQVR